MSASQRSSFFPWDHAGPSSSVGGAALGIYGSDILSALHPASKRGGSLGSRRESFLLPGGGGVPSSPADFGLRNSQIGGEDFLFNGASALKISIPVCRLTCVLVVPEEEMHGEESQQSNALALEKNSFNFLEYVQAFDLNIY